MAFIYVSVVFNQAKTSVLERSMASMDHSFSEAVMQYAKCTSLLKIWKVWHSTVTPKADLSS